MVSLTSEKCDLCFKLMRRHPSNAFGSRMYLLLFECINLLIESLVVTMISGKADSGRTRLMATLDLIRSKRCLLWIHNGSLWIHNVVWETIWFVPKFAR